MFFMIKPRIFSKRLVFILLLLGSGSYFRINTFALGEAATGYQSLPSNRMTNFPEGYQWLWEEYTGAGGDIPGSDVLLWGASLGFYHNATEIWYKIRELEHHFPDLVRITDIGFSYNGRLIPLVIITDERVQTFKTETLVVAHHHGREVITIETSLYFIDKLIYDFINDDDFTQTLLAKTVIYIIPTLNPDSLDIVYQWPYVRKNLHPIDEDNDGIRDEVEVIYNHDSSDNDTTVGEDLPGGVDLNRNYPFQWENTNGNSPDPSSVVYRGEKPFSEPETRAFANFVRQHDFQTAVSLHSGIALIITPWSYDPLIPCPDETLYAGIASKLTELTSFPNSNLYPATGEWGDWMYAARGTLAVTIEVYGGPYDSIWDFFNPPPNEVLWVCEQTYPGLTYMANYLRPELNIEPLENVSTIAPYSHTTSTNSIVKILFLPFFLGWGGIMVLHWNKKEKK